MKIVGQKAGGSKQRKPVIAPDTAQSKTIAKIMYGLSEGVIKGLVEGGKSIYLDDTPIVAENGQQNFDRVGYEFRAGTNDQTYIKGFEEVASEIAVGVELKHSRPWVKSLRNLELDAVTIRIRFAALRQTNDSNGDVSGTTVEYAIDTMTDGTAWVEYGRYKVSDKTSAGYERTHRVDLPKARTGWQIRVRRLTADNHSDYLSNQSYIQAYTEIIDAKMAYPNTALLAINYDSEIFSNVPKMSVECYGVEILVPSNYDPVTRQYSGVWNGSFKRAYTDNPAWHFYDACINKRYALGYRIDSSMIDKWSIYRIAQYCDELVDDGKGGREPRFTLNVYEQSEDSAWSVLSKMAGAFRAFVYWDGTAIICDADIPQDTFYTFTAANVIDGIFEYSGTAPRDRHTVARVAWNNPSNRYKTEYVIVRDDAAISMHGIKIVDIQAYGCTSESQAQRAGLWALKSEQLETQTVTFKTGLDGFIPLPGKIIEIADPYYMGADNGGRIVAVNARQNEITVDRDDVVCNVGDRLVVNTANGVAQARIVKSIRGRVITVVSPFDNVQVESIWVVDAHRIATRKFRVISVRQDDSHQFTITALQHNPAKYDVIDNGAYIDERPTSLLNTSVQTPVNNVQISSRQHIEQGLNVTTLIISFDQAPNATKYLIEWKKDDNPWQRLPETGKNSVEISNVYAGQYQVRVTAISGFGVTSLASYSSLTQIAGKAGRPNRPAFIRATGTLFGMRLDWGFNSKSEDTNYTEIQVSPDGRSNIATLGTFAYPTDKHEIQGLQGNLTQFYRARIVDKLGNTSDWTAWANGTTDANPEKILNIMSGHISEGMLDGVLTGKLNKLNQNYRLLDGKIAQEARDRAEAVRAEVTRTNREIDDRIKTAKQGIDQQIKQVSDGANTTLEQFNSYKQSNDRALGAVSTLVNTTVNNVSAVSQRVDRVESNITTVQNGLATKADSSTLTNYYTKSETDSAVAGKVDEFKSSIKLSSSNLLNGTAQMEIGRGTWGDANFRLSGQGVIETVNVADSPVPSVTKGIKLTVGSNAGMQVGIAQDVVPIPIGEVTLSVWVKGVRGDSIVLQPYYYGTGHNPVTKLFPLNGEWQYIHLTAPNTQYKNRMTAGYIYLRGARANNSAIIVAPMLVEGGFPATWQPSLSDISKELDANAQAIEQANTDVRRDLDGKIKANADKLLSLNSAVDNIEKGLATKANASALVNYYTKSETDRAVAGKVEEFKSTYNEKLAELQKSLKSSELDLRQLDPNTYYPVTFTGLRHSEIRLIRVSRSLGDFPEKPTWAKHQSGFSLSCEWSVNGHGWGSIAVTRNISSFAFAWISDDKSPLIMIGQMTNSSQEYCYLRGGARYKLEAHPDIVATIRTTSYSLHSQTVAPMAYNADLVPKADKQAIQALIAEESRARATAMESIAETVREHTTTLDGYSSTIRQQTQSINGISNLYAIKVDNNGVMSGFGLTSELINGQVRSEFGINADSFYIGNPANGKKPFIFNANPRVIDGVSYPAGVYLNGNMIATGTITGEHIRANSSINAPNITGGQIAIGNNFTVSNQGHITAKSGEIGGLNLLANGLQSKNYRQNQSGFFIRNDGTIELNNPVVMRQQRVASGRHPLPNFRLGRGDGLWFSDAIWIDTGHSISSWNTDKDAFIVMLGTYGTWTSSNYYVNENSNEVLWGVHGEIVPFTAWNGRGSRFFIKASVCSKRMEQTGGDAGLTWHLYKLS